MSNPTWALPLAMVFVALACASPQQQPEAGSSTAGQPRYGGTLNVPVAGDPFDWDISYNARATPNEVLLLTYNTLLQFQAGPEIGFTGTVLQPSLAEQWEVSPDARTFTFHLRKGVKYINQPPVNGRELTAADVKWTIEYRTRTGELKDKKLPRGDADFIFEGLEGLDTPDPYTVTVRFKERFAPFVNYAASDWNPILPREIYDQDGHYKDRMAGTGPFILDTAGSQKGSRWVWKKNAAYWETGQPYLDEIRWLVVPDEAAQFAAFQSKQLDIMEQLRNTPFQDVKKASPQIGVFKFYATNSQLLFLSQVNGGPLTDIRVRRALSMSVDRDEINQVISGGEGLWAVPAATAGTYSEAETRQLVRQSVDEAKRLLAEAGFAGGLAVEWPIPRDETAANMTLAQLIQAQVKRAGINLNIKLMDRAEQRAKRRTGDFDIDNNWGGVGVLNSDLDSLVFPRYFSTASQNYSKINDPELDVLLLATRRETEPARRAEANRQVSMRLIDRAWNIDLTYPPNFNVWHPHVKNYHPHFTNLPQYRNVWLEK
jgi:ABC-type transport system substrate-binding protein